MSEIIAKPQNVAATEGTHSLHTLQSEVSESDTKHPDSSRLSNEYSTSEKTLVLKFK